jgi:flagellar biosynthesis/type III secretory pathway protein FliH
MSRLISLPSVGAAPVAVPVPGTWDAVATAAYEQGRREGFDEGRALGRQELALLAEPLSTAIDLCCERIVAAHRDLARRTAELADLYATTVLRHATGEFVRGHLLRLEETLAALDEGSVEVRVPPALVDQTEQAMAHRSSKMAVLVVGDPALGDGEFRVRAEWADAEGTFERFVEAAREALALYMADEAP